MTRGTVHESLWEAVDSYHWTLEKEVLSLSFGTNLEG